MRNHRASVVAFAVFLGGLQPACGNSPPETRAPTPEIPSFGAPGTIRVSGANPLPLATLFGQNYWCWSNYGSSVRGTETLVAGLQLGVLRAGGHNNDTNTSNGFDPFDESEIDAYVAYCRRVGAEPILQVPLLKSVKGGRAAAQDAADVVGYCNRTKGDGGRRLSAATGTVKASPPRGQG